MDQSVNNKQKEKPLFDISEVASSIKKDLKQTKAAPKKVSKSSEVKDDRFFYTGIDGFDQLLKFGIPKGLNVLIEGSAGCGKTIFSLQMLCHHAKQGKKCLFISFEEPEDRLIDHMKSFGWDPEPLIEKGYLKIKRYLTSDIYYEEDRNTAGGVQAMMARSSNHLMLDLEPFIIGAEGFNPELTVIDSLTAIASTFIGKDRNYRFYLERLFRFFENLGSTNFLITEPTGASLGFQDTKCEEFLSDGIITLYNARRGNIRENAIEILKIRGAQHEKKTVAMQITENGIVVFPEQEIFGDLEK
jgi:circadian clock protein KaiC